MPQEMLLTPIVVIVALLLVAALSAIVTRSIRFPYTVGLVVVGMLLGYAARHVAFLAPMKQVQLTPDIIFYVLLPTLIFAAAIAIDVHVLFENIAAVLRLSVTGLIASAAIVGLALGKLTPLSFTVAFLFGALISATDPVAVIALFNEIGAPRRLTTVVDGESLFNDATAIVLFHVILAMAVGGTAVGVSAVARGVLDFFVVFFGGIAVGAVVGVAVMWLVRLAKDDALIQIAFTTVLAYVAFIVADRVLKVSGIMSVLSAGIVAGWRGKRIFRPGIAGYIKNYWTYAAFLANSFIFLLLGFTEDILFVDLDHHRAYAVFMLWAIIAVTAARAAVVFGLIPLNNRLSKAEPIDRGQQTVIWWGGLRGAIPMALALSLPEGFPNRELLIDLTLGIVLFTLLVQGTTIKWMLRFFKLGR